MEYKAYYKCRLCGDVFTNGATTGQEIAMQHIHQTAAGVMPDYLANQAPGKYVHHCGGDYNHSMGIADFQGWRAEQEENI